MSEVSEKESVEPQAEPDAFEVITRNLVDEQDTIAAAHRDGKAWEKDLFMGSDRIRVCYAPKTKDHGIFFVKEEEIAPGEKVFRTARIADFIPVRERVEVLHKADPGSYESELYVLPNGTSQSRYVVAVYTWDGRRHSRSEMGPKSSSDLKAIREEFKCGLILPTSPAQIAIVTNVLLSLYDMSESETKLFPHTGWVKIDGKHVYLAPQGSVDASGRAKAPVRVVDAGTDAGKVRGELQYVGFPNIPSLQSEEDAKDIRAAMQQLRASVSSRLYVVVLCYAIASVIPQDEPGVLTFLGRFSSGKTAISKAILSFFSGLGVLHSRLPHFSLKNTSTSDAGMQALLGWLRHCTAMMDDFYPATSKSTAEMLLDLVSSFMNSIYNGIVPSKSDLSGGAVRRDGPDTLGIITSEMNVPVGDGSTSRLTKYPMEQGEFTFDEFKRLDPLLKKGDGFRKYAALHIQALAEMMDEEGVDRVRERAMESRLEMRLACADLDTSPSLRTMTSNGVFVAGFDLMRRVAEKHAGTPVGDVLGAVLPSSDDVEDTYRWIVQQNLEGLKGNSVQAKIIEFLRQQIEAGKAYLRPENGAEATQEQGLAYGWVQNPVLDRLVTPPNAIRVGDISKDQKFVHVQVSAIKVAASATGANLGEGELYELLSEYLVKNARPNAYPSKKYHFSNGTETRARGFTIDATRLGFDPIEMEKEEE